MPPTPGCQCVEGERDCSRGPENRCSLAGCREGSLNGLGGSQTRKNRLKACWNTGKSGSQGADIRAVLTPRKLGAQFMTGAAAAETSGWAISIGVWRKRRVDSGDPDSFPW